jgi:prefoldin subunit 5
MTVEQAIEFYNKKTESLNEEAESLREEHSFIK